MLQYNILILSPLNKIGLLQALSQNRLCSTHLIKFSTLNVTQKQKRSPNFRMAVFLVFVKQYILRM